MTADTDTAAPGGPGVGIQAALEVVAGGLGQVLDKLSQQERRETLLWQDVHLVPIIGGAVQLTAGAGTLDQPDRMGPHDPYWWDVRRLSAWGFTAGTVNVTLNDATGNGELLASFPQAGQFTWSGQLFLGPRDRLVITATGITGNVFIAGQAAEIAATMLPRYLL
jgi:hypothetical protein